MILVKFALAAKAAHHHFQRKHKAGSIGIKQKKILPTAENAHPMTVQNLILKQMFLQVCPCLSSSLMPWVSQHHAELDTRCANVNY